MNINRTVISVIVILPIFLTPVASVVASPSFVTHVPSDPVYNVPGATMRDPLTPREGEPTYAYIKTGPSFSYTSVAVYYTDDGSTPNGSKGQTFGSTMVLLSYGPDIKVNFLHNEGGDDWIKADFPYFTQPYGTQIRYKIGVWDYNSPSEPEVWADAGTVYEWTTRLAWPGAGSGSANPDEGYPLVHFWKEEGVAGNNFINVMLDQNGSIYDAYYPSAGCVQGMGTKNEGYVDGLDTFPAGLPQGSRGQMNLNQAMAGIRIDGTTYWLSNAAGTDYSGVTQSYIADTNVIETAQQLVADGNDIAVQQYDIAPKDITFPTDDGGLPNRGLHVKRVILTNNGAADKTVDFYFYADFALNGGDDYDGTFADVPRGAMIAYDNTQRNTSASGEYNPTTFADYNKNVSIYLGVAMKQLDTVGGDTGTVATDFWSDTSGDEGLGWIASRIDLPAGTSKELNVLLVGGFDPVAGQTGTYDYFMDSAIDWFHSHNMSTVQAATESYWQTWLASGVGIDFPDDRFDETFKRGLLATALHLDGENGGIIAGMHNGAYPFVWPRDAAWAAITLARAGHVDDAKEIYTFLRDIAYRDVEGWGRKGFWKQKYSTDGYTIWGTPQVDETSCYPWGIRYIYNVTGDIPFLSDHYGEVYDAALASSQDSTLDTRLRYEDGVKLMYSMSLWEDAFDTFIYSNASVVQGLLDAAEIADILDQNVCSGGPGTCGYDEDKTLFEARAAEIRQGVIDRYNWDGENTDISQIGAAYPFNVLDIDDPIIAHALDRINGVGHPYPLINPTGEWEGLINRYWNDGYWNNAAAPNPNGSPWFLSTLWYGCYYAARQDVTPDKSDIDNHAYRTGLLLDRLGPIGFGAEQIAPSNSLLYPGQMNFVLQTAWPNAWESMSFLVDAMMAFLDYTPDAPGNTLRIEPKLPTGWDTMTFTNLAVGDHRIDVTCTEAPGINGNTFTNRTGNPVNYHTVIRVPSGSIVLGATQTDSAGCVVVPSVYDAATGRVQVTGSLDTGIDSVTTVEVHRGIRGDMNRNASVDIDNDLPIFAAVLLGGDTDCVHIIIADVNGDGDTNGNDIQPFVQALVGP